MPIREIAQVLIVDSDLEVCRVIQHVLHQEGHEVQIVNEPRAAVQFAREHSPEAILLDRGINNGIGLELIGALFEASPTSPIIISTTDASIESEILVREHGAFDVVKKPYTNLTLVAQRLNVAIQTSKALRERDSLIEELDRGQAEVPALRSQIEELNDKLARINQDELRGIDSGTGLLTEDELFDRLKLETNRALRYSRPITVAVAHIDGHQEIAARCGTNYSDIALQKVASAMVQTVRDVDLVGRCGPNNIAVVFPETDKVQGLVAAERIRSYVEQTCLIAKNHSDPAPFNVTVTIGFASLPTDTMNGNNLLACARGAQEAASSVGVNHILGFRN